MKSLSVVIASAWIHTLEWEESYEILWWKIIKTRSLRAVHHQVLVIKEQSLLQLISKDAEISAAVGCGYKGLLKQEMWEGSFPGTSSPAIIGGRKTIYDLLKSEVHLVTLLAWEEWCRLIKSHCKETSWALVDNQADREIFQKRLPGMLLWHRVRIPSVPQLCRNILVHI